MKQFLIILSAALLLSCTNSIAQKSSFTDSRSKNSTANKSVQEEEQYNGHKVFTGPKGGKYYINSNGNKSYLPRNKSLKKSNKAVQKFVNDETEYYNGHEIITGPRGGKYYINKNGNKTYLKR